MRISYWSSDVCSSDLQAAAELDQYATRHNPFMYFRSIIDDQPYCDEHVVNLDDAFIDDLRSVDTTPAYSFITPNLCDDGHDANCANGDRKSTRLNSSH